MTINDFIKEINNYITGYRKKNNIDAKGHFILSHTVEQHPTFKVFKTYTYTLYYYKGKSYLIDKFSYTLKDSSDKEDSTILKELEHFIFPILIEFIRSKDFNDIITEEYAFNRV